MAKLAEYEFDPKYVPGTKNIVAGPYISLMDEVNGVVTGTVKDAFRVSNHCQNVQAFSNDQNKNEMQDVNNSCPGSFGADEVSAALSACSHDVICLLPIANPTSLQFSSEDPSVTIPLSRLSSLQEQDGILGGVNYVLRNRHPSKRERAMEPRSVTFLLKHWKKLKICNHVLYRVKRVYS